MIENFYIDKKKSVNELTAKEASPKLCQQVWRLWFKFNSTNRVQHLIISIK